MEPHIVPQNVTDVEFKLFGSFTVKEFFKIVFACLLAVGVYFIPFLPDLIKYSLIAFSLFSGFMAAMVPNFGIWLNAVLRAVFISPRYIWMRTAIAPEIFLTDMEKGVETELKVSLASKKSIDIDEAADGNVFTQDIGISEMSTMQTVNKNFENTYSSAYSDNNTAPQVVGNNKIAGSVSNIKKIGPNKSLVYDEPIQPISNVAMTERLRDLISKNLVSPEAKANIFEKIDDIKKLKITLTEKNISEGERESMMEQISEIYSQIKSQVDKIENQAVVTKRTQGGVQVSPRAAEGQILFGVVVDKSDRPIEGATVSLNLINGKGKYTLKTNNYGKFMTDFIVPQGSYEVAIEHESKKFHRYKISVANTALPAYKLKEK